MMSGSSCLRYVCLKPKSFWPCSRTCTFRPSKFSTAPVQNQTYYQKQMLAPTVVNAAVHRHTDVGSHHYDSSSNKNQNFQCSRHNWLPIQAVLKMDPVQVVRLYDLVSISETMPLNKTKTAFWVFMSKGVRIHAAKITNVGCTNVNSTTQMWLVIVQYMIQLVGKACRPGLGSNETDHHAHWSGYLLSQTSN